MSIWVEKQRHILDFTLSALARRKGKNLSLFIIYTALIFLLASVMFFTHALRQEAKLILQDAPPLIVQRLAMGRHDMIPVQYVETLREIPGVRNARGRLWGYYFDPLAGANYTLLVPPEFPHGDGTIGIGQGISRARAAYPGDIMPLRGYDGQLQYFTIAEILSPPSELVSSDLMLIGERDFRALFNLKPDQYTDIVVDVPNEREVATVAQKIVRLLPDSRPITRREMLRTYESIFDWRSGLITVVLASAVLAFVIFAWDKASGLSAEERREIGILKAIGWETSDVLLMKFWEGAVISLTSFCTGIVLAYIHVFFSSAVLFEPVLKGWSVLYPQFRLTPFVSLYQAATLFFLTVAPYTLATIIPSWRAATVDPDSIMRA